MAERKSKSKSKTADVPKETIEAVEEVQEAIDAMPAMESDVPLDLEGLDSLGLVAEPVKASKKSQGRRSKNSKEESKEAVEKPRGGYKPAGAFSETTRAVLEWDGKDAELKSVRVKLDYQMAAKEEERMEDVIAGLMAQEASLATYIDANEEPEPMAYSTAIKEFGEALDRRARELQRDQNILSRLKARYAEMEAEAKERVAWIAGESD